MSAVCTLRLLISFSTDSDGTPKQNMANLALKGILGTRAMAEISAAVENNGDHSTYLACGLPPLLSHLTDLVK